MQPVDFRENERLLQGILGELDILPRLESLSHASPAWQEFKTQYPEIAAKLPDILAADLSQFLAYKLHLQEQAPVDFDLFNLIWKNAWSFLLEKHHFHSQTQQALQAKMRDKIARGLQQMTPPVVSSGDIPTTPSSEMGKWQYLPLPQDEPDFHGESYVKGTQTSAGYHLLGARVRGKKHKHEGTHCDDWFEFSTFGEWSAIAVADGAGSKKFSRVGARVACECAVESLASALRGHKLEKREKWSVEMFQRDTTTGTFQAEDLETVQKALHRAMQTAYQGVEKAWRDRANSFQHAQFLGFRPPQLEDFSCTLLLAVHCLVEYKNERYSFIMTCQVGDGILAALDQQMKVQLLSSPDTGRFSGETEFLNHLNQLTRDNLMRKTYPYFSPLNAFFVMTDGVADDYFPAGERMLELYGDLLCNQIMPIAESSPEVIQQALEQTSVQCSYALQALKNRYQMTVQPLLKKNELASEFPLIVCSKVAHFLGVSLTEFITSPPLINAILQHQEREIKPEKALLKWLDNYTIKGSFDDRTLVILHPKI